jgi:hypothetical protein
MTQSTTGQSYMTKSMNGIVVYDDGAGTVIENGTITTNTFNTTNFNCNNIQGIAPADAITLYTDTTGNIRLGELSTNLNTISGATVDLRSTDLVFDTNNDADFETGNNLLMNTVGTTDIVSTQITLNATGKVRIGGGQDIEPVTPANPLYIGNDITSANFFLGNATYPPSCTATATTANHICNYSTVQSLVAGGGSSILSSNNTFTGSNTFTQPLLCDSYQPTANVLNIGTAPTVLNDITIGAPLSRTVMQGSQVTISTLRSDEIRAINNVSHNLFANTLASNTADINIGSAVLAHTNTLNLSANDGVCNIATIASRTADVNILTGSPLCSGDLNIGTGTAFAGDIRIATLSSVPNTVSIGSVSTTNTLIGANLNLNTSGNGNTKINNTAAQTGTVAIGNTSTTSNTILGASIAIGNSGTNAITIGSASTTALNIGEPMTPTYGYDATSGTNIVGTIGYIYRGSVTTGSLPNSSLQTHGTISNVPVGVYYVYASVCVDTTTVGQITYQQYSIDTGVDTNPFAILGIATGTAPGNCTDRTYFGNLSGVTCLTATSTIRVRTFWQFSSGSFSRNGTSFSFAAVRIA